MGARAFSKISYDDFPGFSINIQFYALYFIDIYPRLAFQIAQMQFSWWNIISEL